MTYKSEGDGYTIAAEQARVKVGRAMMGHNRGTASVDAVNKANSDLAEAHFRWRECQNGNVPDDR
jgi:hypothetical protein